GCCTRRHRCPRRPGWPISHSRPSAGRWPSPSAHEIRSERDPEMTTRYDEYGDSRIADARLRAGDADRERVADQLRKAHAEGRLAADELSERIGRCLQARTFGELERLTADVRQPDRGGGLTLARRRSRPGLRIVLAAIIALWAL